MTRINCVPVECLTKKHLQAEYFELPRVLTAVEKLVAQGKTVKDVDIPDSYTLGTGHMKFFYNKLFYLYVRHRKLYYELRNREVFVDNEKFIKVGQRFQNEELRNREWLHNWNPSPEDMYLNMKRLTERHFEKKKMNEKLEGFDLELARKVLGESGLQRLIKFSSFPDGWDGEDAKSVQRSSIEVLFELLLLLSPEHKVSLFLDTGGFFCISFIGKDLDLVDLQCI